MRHTDYVKEDIWFAWFPVKVGNMWIWLENVKRTIDTRPLVYLGLMEEIKYQVIKENL